MLIVGPTAEAADDLYLRAANSKGTWFGIKRFTLNGLAAHLARPMLAESGHASASGLSFIAVAARVIHTLQLDGKLSYFAPVADRPGFPVAVGRTLEELRMNEVDMQAIARLERGGSDLARIAQAVEQELDESKLADRATIFRAAIDALRSENKTETAQLRHYGGILASTSQTVAMGGWKYEDGLFRQAGFPDALRYVRDLYASFDP
jgi:hypothetical protein